MDKILEQLRNPKVAAAVGFVVGLIVFRRLGLVPTAAAAPEASDPRVAAPSEISRPYAAVVLTIAACLALWTSVELLR